MTTAKKTAAKPATHNDQESWKNQSEGTVILRRMDHRGEMNRDEVIPGGRVLHITSEERRINQEMAAHPQLDVFANGTMTPVRLLADSLDANEIASNPNLLSEDDMRGLLGGSASALAAKLTEIHNVGTLERFLAVARDMDAPVSRVDGVTRRLTELTAVEEPRETAGPRGRPRAVTPV